MLGIMFDRIHDHENHDLVHGVLNMKIREFCQNF